MDTLIEYISNQTSSLAPTFLPLPPLTKLALSTPLASIPLLTQLLEHITTQPVHQTYAPFLRFGAIHAARVSLVWAKLTSKGDRRDVGRLQDLFGYLVAAWAGGTILSILIGEPPFWLLSPTPWLIYPLVYILLIPTGLSSFITTTTPTFVDLSGAYVDGVARGLAIASIPTSLSGTKLADASPWTVAFLTGIAHSSGAWVIQMFNLNAPKWSLGVPAILSGKSNHLLESMDLWAGMLIALVYYALMGMYKELEPLSGVLRVILPDDVMLKTARLGGPIVDADTARAVAVLLLGSLLFARVVTRLVVRTTPQVRTKKVVEKTDDGWMDGDAGVNEKTGGKAKKTEVVKAPAKAQPEGSKGQSRKRGKSKETR